eukprot:4729952-Pyramimonas_sp.AAC.1
MAIAFFLLVSIPLRFPPSPSPCKRPGGKCRAGTGTRAAKTRWRVGSAWSDQRPRVGRGNETCNAPSALSPAPGANRPHLVEAAMGATLSPPANPLTTVSLGPCCKPATSRWPWPFSWTRRANTRGPIVI